ncbi:MAG: GNAT family N-acetyltransferase [Bacteroidetes bacterium]|nr:GNAT family N-acetyltransferase [Bacteroidota bacterium]MCB9043497.1 GNAT family N-acetyltransferase [Chitinophagales bacterium]
MLWKYKQFSLLNTFELYEIIRLRQEVFVVEQNCPYLDADGKDLESDHLMGFDYNSKLVAYARIVHPGISYNEISLGRVVTAPSHRRQELGILLMQTTLEKIYNEYGDVPVRISAQCYLENFYQKFGFQVVSEPYMEDDIPHVEMFLEKMLR